MKTLLINTRQDGKPKHILNVLNDISITTPGDLLLFKSLEHINSVIRNSPLLKIPSEILICFEDNLYHQISVRIPHAIEISEQSLAIIFKSYITNHNLFDFKTRIKVFETKDKLTFDIIEQFFDIDGKTTIQDIQQIIEDPIVLLQLYYLLGYRSKGILGLRCYQHLAMNKVN